VDVAPKTVDLALADLTELSAQIEAAVVASPDGEAQASTLPEPAGAAFARAAAELLREAGDRAVAAEAATGQGSLFAVRDGERLVAAVTGRGAPSGLVLYDLRTCLRRLAEEPERPRKRAPRKQKEPDAAA
jgi:predicted regulator of Ras-like GTPase activity (Roadblock/LC7/MglB family)